MASPDDPKSTLISDAKASGIAARRQTQDTKLESTAAAAGATPLSPQLSTRSRGGTANADRPSSPRTTFNLRRAATTMLEPEHKLGPAPSLVQCLKAIATNSWLNVLLVCIPVSWALHFAEQGSTIIFLFSFFAIIPLAKLLAFATDELSMRVGQTLAGLLNATLGNAVELIVAIIALTNCELHIVQSSLVGSILSNLLLVLGMCFFAGGTRFSEQGFGVSATQLNSSLLTISVIAVLLPAAFHFAVEPGANTSPDLNEGKEILALSHGVAIILLFIYGAFLVFQLQTHASLYSGKDIPKSTAYAKKIPKEKKSGEGMSSSVAHTVSDSVSAPSSGHDEEAAREEEQEEIPELSFVVTCVLLVTVTALVAVTAKFLVDSIDGLVENGKISKEFVGVILLPIVGNAAEHVTAVTVSVKDKLTLSLGVAIGSSIQIALFVIPFIVTLGWILNKPMTLLFDPYESVVLFLSVLTVNYCVQDGKSNWLEGMILLCLYLILGVTFWFYPGSDPSSLVTQQCH